VIRAKDLRVALGTFDPIWEQMTPTEQTRVVELLIERVDYDGAEENLSITFRPAGVRLAAAQGHNAAREAGA
jgi:site-specific DNA recombinase